MDCEPTAHKNLEIPMKIPNLFRSTFRASTLTLALSLAAAGCHKTIDDATLTTNVHTALAADSAIATEPIQPTVVAGVVTLNGNVSNDTARAVAARDAAVVKGVKQVVNALSIQGMAVTPEITQPEAPTEPRMATRPERQAIARHEPLPPPPPPLAPMPVQAPEQAPPPQPAPVAQTPPPPPLPSAPAPIVRNVSVPSGTGISVRVNQTLDSESTQEGTAFTGVVTSSVIVDGQVAIPAGSQVSGTVIDVHEAGHYKGNSLLSVQLNSIRRRGERIDVSTEAYTLEGKGRGKNTAAKVGGGAAVGAILGGIFGGGKGAAIGAGVGAGAGGVANGVTRGEQVQITSESIIRFRLANGFTVRSFGSTDERDENPSNGGLQPRE
jgi:hypothetical protein